MSVFLITMEGGRKVARPITGREEFVALRNSPAQQRNLELARHGDEKAKRRMLQFCYSCLLLEGVLRGCRRMSDCVGMDVDFCPNSPDYDRLMQELPARVMEKREELGLLMLERSVRKGYHIVFRRRSGLSQEENLRWASRVLGVQYDEGAKDITRVFFSTTADADELLFLDDALFCLREAEELAVTSPAPPVDAEAGNGAEETYLGIPYGMIIDKWWELHHGGQTPVRSNRDVLTYELAVNLRHICGFDRALMGRVIPCYDGFLPEEKMKCIDSALETRRTQMPRRLREVLDAVRRENASNVAVVQAVDEAKMNDALYYFRILPRRVLPMGMNDSLKAVGPAFLMPVMTAVCPIIGALATGVRVDIHGDVNSLNLICFIVGEAASGKGSLDALVRAWTADLRQQDNLYTEQERLWREKKRAAKNAKTQPEEPKLPVRLLTLNNTLANISERLGNTQGMHAFSFTPEADTVAQKWRSGLTDFSVMLRQAYDASRYDREARSVDAVNVHIEALRWNVVMCGTQDALYRVVQNYTDGLLSRMVIACAPDNTFSPLQGHVPHLTVDQSERIGQVARLLPLMKGTAVLPRLEKRSREWVEQVRVEAMQNDDRVMARCRLRDHVSAFRMTVCLMLCRVCERLILEHGTEKAEGLLRADPQMWIPMMAEAQTQAMMELYDLIADAILEHDLCFFRSRLERVYGTEGGEIPYGRQRGGSNDTIYARLDNEFTFEQAFLQSTAVKGSAITHNAVRCMLKNWCRQGIAERTGNGAFRKAG